uniref:Uncharacterized protein n=1 Tax=Acrobeloides nanus TaxID=290746 RepID=A0A914CMA3_9BILA
MGKKFLIFSIFIGVVLLRAIDGKRLKKIMLNGRPFFGFRPPRHPLDSKEEQRNKDMFPDLWFNQKLDHFDSNNNVMWKQRYWYNKNNAANDAPQFIMMGQEGPSSNRDVADDRIPFNYWGKQVGAGLWSLEHRFYGMSRPFPEQTTENLKYLTSRQYLEDVANFIRYQNQALNLTSSKWIIFGGSYSGALALWMRELYPELTIGAVGSSGPVEPALDFYNYLQVCDNSFRMYSQECAESIAEAMKALQDDIEYNNGRNSLNLIFELEPTFDKLNLTYQDLQNFLSTAVGNFMTAVQYSRVNGGPFEHDASIPDLCDIMLMPSYNPVLKIGQVNQYMTEIMYTPGEFDGTANSYADLIKSLQDPTYDPTGDNAAGRSWTWQTCNEFGYFQSTDAGRTIWGSKIPNNFYIDIFYIDMCTDIFGPEYNVDYIKNAVEKTKQQYGGRDHYNGTNVVMPNGNVDPWHALGNYKSNDPSVIPILINGTAHCADMEPQNENDPESLTNARVIIFQNIQKWIQEASVIQAPKSKNQHNLQKPMTSKKREIKNWDAEIKFGEDIEHRFKKLHTGGSRRNKTTYLFGRTSGHGFLIPPENADDLNSTANWIQQDLDHFDSTNTKTFQQRFWYNGQFYKPGGPIFLMISGESAAGSKWIENENVTWLTLAKTYNAAAYMVEHRYYGYTRPTSDLSTENLKWLSSEQALADLAVFITAINRKMSYVNPKWVSFGGSYSGALSAWFREKYPELVVAAVGSSGPVLAKVDFFEYLQVVQASISSYNQTCADNIQAGFEAIQQRLNTIDGRQELNNVFNICSSGQTNQSYVPVKDIQNFMSNLVGLFQGTVQYSGDNTQIAIGMGIPEICAVMLDTSHSPMENIQNVNIYISKGIYGNGTVYCNDPSYSDFINEIKDTSYDGIADDRCWIWQTCTEFGYFQSTDLGRNIFGSSIPGDFYIDMCTDIFGAEFNRSTIDAAIATTLENYGGTSNYNGTKVILPNGSVDPWHALGLANGTSSSVIPIFIHGTAHCADMYPARPNDLPELVQARQQISQILGTWLSS